jgi:cobalt-zinc-cadmium efflux system outer membrane protein
MKYANALLLCLALFSAGVIAQETSEQSPPPREENIHTLIAEVLSRNPDIAAEFYKMEAAIRRVPQSGALDDPELIFKLMEIPGTRFNEAMYANVELMQMIPFPTKLAARRSIGNLLSEHAHHDHMEKVVQIISDLKSALAMLWYERESLAINASNQQLMQKVLKVAETAYTVGKVPQQDILRTKIELAKLTADDANIRQEIVSAESMVRRLLNRSAEAPLGMINLPPPSTPPSLNVILTYAERFRPMLVHDSLNVLEKEMNVRLMRQEYIPDLKLSVEYVRLPMTMENRWSVSAGISLPFAPWTLTKASSRVQEAESEQLMLSSMYASSKSMVQSQIRSKHAALNGLATQFGQIQDVVLPLLSQSINLLLTDYENGRTSYSMVLEEYKMYNDTKRDRAMTLMKYHQTLADLEREVGVTDVTSIGGSGKEQQP